MERGGGTKKGAPNEGTPTQGAPTAPRPPSTCVRGVQGSGAGAGRGRPGAFIAPVRVAAPRAGSEIKASGRPPLGMCRSLGWVPGQTDGQTDRRAPDRLWAPSPLAPSPQPCFGHASCTPASPRGCRRGARSPALFCAPPPCPLAGVPSPWYWCGGVVADCCTSCTEQTSPGTRPPLGKAGQEPPAPHRAVAPRGPRHPPALGALCAAFAAPPGPGSPTALGAPGHCLAARGSGTSPLTAGGPRDAAPAAPGGHGPGEGLEVLGRDPRRAGGGSAHAAPPAGPCRAAEGYGAAAPAAPGRVCAYRGHQIRDGAGGAEEPGSRHASAAPFPPGSAWHSRQAAALGVPAAPGGPQTPSGTPPGVGLSRAEGQRWLLQQTPRGGWHSRRGGRAWGAG